MIVKDIDKAIDFYTRIGFEESFRNDIVYAIVKMGDFAIHIGTHLDYVGAGQSQAAIEMTGSMRTTPSVKSREPKSSGSFKTGYTG